MIFYYRNIPIVATWHGIVPIEIKDAFEKYEYETGVKDTFITYDYRYIKRFNGK